MNKRKLDDETDNKPTRVLSRFKSDTGEILPGGLLDLPVNITVNKLQAICNALLQHEEPVPLAFYVNNIEITDTLEKNIEKNFNISENVLEIIYQPQAVFKVKAVTRCTGSLEGNKDSIIYDKVIKILFLYSGHKEAVISVAFSPDGKYLASGSGDTTVRFWDIYTQTPYYTCEGHKHWVLCISWSPCSNKLVSACKNGMILQWDPKTGKQVGKCLEVSIQFN